jgi:hypothetical protein
MDQKVKSGSVVQISPGFSVNKAFATCFLTVDKVKPWGVTGYVQALGDTRSSVGDQAWIRIEWADLAYVGEAVWMITD